MSPVELARLTLEHVLLCAVALVLAMAVAVPLGLWVHGHARRTAVVTSAAGGLYTVPSLALFALLVPLVGLGPVPVVAGLVAYSQLSLVRAVVDGLDSVPEDARDAALGMGLPRWTVLARVDAPLALPIFLAGVRSATVTLIGIATIGAIVDAGGLGSLILEGIQRDHVTRVLAGAGAVTALAIGTDAAFAQLERRARPWAQLAAGRGSS